MRNILLPAAAASAALLALAGCNSAPEVINTVERETNAPAPLPANVTVPTITDSKIYRCAYPGNEVYYVDFRSNNTASIRTGNASAPAAQLAGTEPTGPFTGEGFTVSGNGSQVTINGKSCRARS